MGNVLPSWQDVPARHHWYWPLLLLLQTPFDDEARQYFGSFPRVQPERGQNPGKGHSLNPDTVELISRMRCGSVGLEARDREGIWRVV